VLFDGCAGLACDSVLKSGVLPIGPDEFREQEIQQVAEVLGFLLQLEASWKTTQLRRSSISHRSVTCVCLSMALAVTPAGPSRCKQQKQ